PDDEYSWHFCLLSRQRGCSRERRCRRGRRAGREIYPKEARCRLSAPCHFECSGGCRSKTVRNRFGGLLRQAIYQVRAFARDLHCIRAPRLAVVQHGYTNLAEGETVPEETAAKVVEGVRRGL